MNSIESLQLDFESQVRLLNKIHTDKISDDCVYVGSGDSYAAGLVTEFVTDHRCRSYSPSDLFNSRFITDKAYCFVSVTGRTRANIKVAERATKAGVRTVAITFDKNSKLAQVCKEIIPIEFTRTQTPTAGFTTFIANLITCLQTSGIKIPEKFGAWHKKGIQLSENFLKSIILPRQESVYLLGNNILYAISLYASFQMAEFFGSSVIAHKLEEFCHSPIFGLNESDYVWVLGQRESHISNRLSGLDLRLSYIELYNQDVLAKLFESVFFVQNLMLLLAQNYGFTELRYVMMKDVLKASSDIIYDQLNQP